MIDNVTLNRDDAFWLVSLANESDSNLIDRNRLARLADEISAQPIRSGRSMDDPGAFDVYVVWVEGMMRAPLAARTVKADAIMIAQIYNMASDGLNCIVLGYCFSGLIHGVEISLAED